jgi:hypothetical protein
MRQTRGDIIIAAEATIAGWKAIPGFERHAPVVRLPPRRSSPGHWPESRILARWGWALRSRIPCCPFPAVLLS